jgi:hypothetical protein
MVAWCPSVLDDLLSAAVGQIFRRRYWVFIADRGLRPAGKRPMKMIEADDRDVLYIVHSSRDSCTSESSSFKLHHSECRLSTAMIK